MKTTVSALCYMIVILAFGYVTEVQLVTWVGMALGAILAVSYIPALVRFIVTH